MLDGFPRTVRAGGRRWTRCSRSAARRSTRVVNLVVPAEVVVSRLRDALECADLRARSTTWRRRRRKVAGVCDDSGGDAEAARGRRARRRCGRGSRCTRRRPRRWSRTTADGAGCATWTASGPPDEVYAALSAALGKVALRDASRARTMIRSTRRTRSTRSGRARGSSAECLRHAGAEVRPGRHDPRAGPAGRGVHPRPRRRGRRSRDTAGFPASICASVNEEVVHGIPGASASCARATSSGCDIGVEKDGYYGDAARTFPVGDDRRRGAAAARGDARGADARHRAGEGRAAGSATSRTRSSGTSKRTASRVVRALVGHGIGRELHEEPQVPNYGRPGEGPRLDGGAWCSRSSRW